MDRQPGQPTPPRPHAWLPVGFSVLILLAATAVVAQRVSTLQSRLDEAESARTKRGGRRAHATRGRAERAFRNPPGARNGFPGAAGRRRARERIENAEQDLGSIGAAIEAHSSSLIELEGDPGELHADDGEGARRARPAPADALRVARSKLVEDASRTATDAEAHLAQLGQSLTAPPDLEAMWRELVGPIVQLAGEASVGSGILLHSEPLPEGGFRTRILTAWHVVRDIRATRRISRSPCPCRSTCEDGDHAAGKGQSCWPTIRRWTSRCSSSSRRTRCPSARLATRSRLAATRIFDPVVAVGCPLGNDPIPTRGEVATCQPRGRRRALLDDQRAHVHRELGRRHLRLGLARAPRDLLEDLHARFAAPDDRAAHGPGRRRWTRSTTGSCRSGTARSSRPSRTLRPSRPHAERPSRDATRGILLVREGIDGERAPRGSGLLLAINAAASGPADLANSGSSRRVDWPPSAPPMKDRASRLLLAPGSRRRRRVLLRARPDRAGDLQRFGRPAGPGARGQRGHRGRRAPTWRPVDCASRAGREPVTASRWIRPDAW